MSIVLSTLITRPLPTMVRGYDFYAMNSSFYNETLQYLPSYFLCFLLTPQQITQALMTVTQHTTTAQTFT